MDQLFKPTFHHRNLYISNDPTQYSMEEPHGQFLEEEEEELVCSEADYAAEQRRQYLARPDVQEILDQKPAHFRMWYDPRKSDVDSLLRCYERAASVPGMEESLAISEQLTALRDAKSKLEIIFDAYRAKDSPK